LGKNQATNSCARKSGKNEVSPDTAAVICRRLVTPQRSAAELTGSGVVKRGGPKGEEVADGVGKKDTGTGSTWCLR